MNWKIKAFIQNIVAFLPEKISYEVYFKIQRHLGNLKKDPNSKLCKDLNNSLVSISQAVDVLKKIRRHSYDINGKIFYEVGTGRFPFFPIVFWLCGAEKIITVDLNPYVRDELIEDMLCYIYKEEDKIKNILGDFLNIKRVNILLDFIKSKKTNKKDFFKLCHVEYIAPGDAAKTNLPANSIDYHISHLVYEHIELNIIRDILIEGNRIITEGGLFINIIDYADHFAYTDKNISLINFLKYNEKTWKKYAENKFMYLNRLRHDDFIELFRSVGHKFVEIETHQNESLIDLLESGKIKLDTKFAKKEKDILSIIKGEFTTKASPCL